MILSYVFIYKLISIQFDLLLLANHFAINVSQNQECPFLHQFSSSVGKNIPAIW